MFWTMAQKTLCLPTALLAVVSLLSNVSVVVAADANSDLATAVAALPNVTIYAGLIQVRIKDASGLTLSRHMS
jgi:hypothetical protein